MASVIKFPQDNNRSMIEDAIAETLRGFDIAEATVIVRRTDGSVDRIDVSQIGSSGQQAGWPSPATRRRLHLT
jgi:hypothetical protein